MGTFFFTHTSARAVPKKHDFLLGFLCASIRCRDTLPMSELRLRDLFRFT